MNQVEKYRVQFGISPAQARILEILSSGEFASSQQLCDAVCKPGSKLKGISVLIHDLRQRIFPIQITTLYGTGYCLNDKNLKALRGEP